jgi:hypothetical protein
MDGDETRAKSLDAGVVLIAVGLVDLALATEFGFERPEYIDWVAMLRAECARRELLVTAPEWLPLRDMGDQEVVT